jgi:regulation of enolase protein 1 (concanavalin A-like superfamily)
VNLFEDCEGKQIPSRLAWLQEPREWGFSEQGLLIVPEAKTDFFRPYGGSAHDSACLLYTEVTGDFTAVTALRAHLVGFGDAGALTVRASATQWAKLCIERSPIGDVSIVSVVTDPWSDDANNELLAAPEGFLRITRKGNVFGMHHSLDGATWRFVRTFGLPMPATVWVGIHAQAPFGGGCRALFTSLDLSPEPVQDFRSGE